MRKLFLTERTVIDGLHHDVGSNTIRRLTVPNHKRSVTKFADHAGGNTIYDGKYVLNTTIYHENPDSTHVSTRVNGWKNETLGGDTRHFEYGYDSAGNIALLRMGGKTTTYRYNALQQLVRENNQAAGKTWLYTYDAGGNILTKKEYAYTTGTVGTVQKTINYTYGNNQWKDLLTAYNGKTISSDAVGNMTSDGTWTYTWEHGKQLAGQSKSGTTISYAYGADGMHLKKTVGSTTYTYAYNGSLLTNVASSAGQNVHIRYDSEGKPVHMQYNKMVMNITICWMRREMWSDWLTEAESW